MLADFSSLFFLDSIYFLICDSCLAVYSTFVTRTTINIHITTTISVVHQLDIANSDCRCLILVSDEPYFCTTCKICSLRKPSLRQFSVNCSCVFVKGFPENYILCKRQWLDWSKGSVGGKGFSSFNTPWSSMDVMCSVELWQCLKHLSC